MKQRLKIAVMLFLMITVCASSFTFAASNYQGQLTQINKQKQDTQSKLKDSKKQEADLAAQIASLDQQILEKQSSIANLEVEIKQTGEQIVQKQLELEIKEQEIAVQNESLNARLRAMYKNGEIGYLEVVLGSGSFSELMNNIDMISRIYAMDEEFLELLQDQYNQIEAVKQQLEELKVSLSDKQETLKTQKASLDEDKNRATELREEIKEDIEEYEKMIDELNKSAEQISALIRASQSSNTTFIGGTFINPAPQYVKISSYYGYRIHPITGTRKLHTGIDLASASGTKCVAAGSGTVIYSGWYGGYGNTIVIDHGGGITTLYGHNSELLVAKGTYVTQGQQIAKIGSTGNSTGPHCHFEVRINGNHTNPSSYLGL